MHRVAPVTLRCRFKKSHVPVTSSPFRPLAVELCTVVHNYGGTPEELFPNRQPVPELYWFHIDISTYIDFYLRYFVYFPRIRDIRDRRLVFPTSRFKIISFLGDGGYGETHNGSIYKDVYHFPYTRTRIIIY